jgi:hypothetical protein
MMEFMLGLIPIDPSFTRKGRGQNENTTWSIGNQRDGGLGLLNTKKKNIALLLKWVWRIYQEEYTIWAKLIRAKYHDATDFFSGSGHGGSQFWKILHKVKHLL